MELHEHPQYATIQDLIHTNDQILSVVDRICRVEIEAESRAVYLANASALSYEMEALRREVGDMKEAIIEIQDSLRRLGLCDLGERLGDLQILLT